MEIVAMLALAGTAAAIILAPLFAPPDRPAPADAADRDNGQSAADALAELEFDHATGKLDDDDYAALRAELLRAGAPAPASPTRGASGAAPAEVLEAEILAARRAARGCASCGAGLPEGARFCPACGAPVVRR